MNLISKFATIPLKKWKKNCKKKRKKDGKKKNCRREREERPWKGKVNHGIFKKNRKLHPITKKI